MRCRQVRKAIDTRAPGHQGSDSRLAILAHCEACAECRRCLDSAGVANSLIKARACEEMEPPPFFKTRVLAAIRERTLTPARASVLNMWRSGRAIVVPMLAVVVILLAMNILAPKGPDYTTTGDPRSAIDSRSGISVDGVVMGGDNTAPSDESLTSGQVLDTVFAQGDSYGFD